MKINARTAFLFFALMLCVEGCTQIPRTVYNSNNISKKLPDQKTDLKVTYATSHMFKIKYADTLRMEAQKAAEEHCGTVGTFIDKGY